MDFCLSDAIGVGLGSGGVEPGAFAKHGVEIRAGEHPTSAKVAIANTAPGTQAATPKPALARSPSNQLIANYGKLPLSFEANQGQTDRTVKFLSRGRGYALFLTGDEAVLTLGRESQNAIRKSQIAKIERAGNEIRNSELEIRRQMPV